MKNKIKQVNDIFDKYDPCHVSPKINKHCADEYVHISAQFITDASKFGAKKAFDNAIECIYGEAHPWVDCDAMFNELKHAV